MSINITILSIDVRSNICVVSFLIIFPMNEYRFVLLKLVILLDKIISVFFTNDLFSFFSLIIFIFSISFILLINFSPLFKPSFNSFIKKL